MEEPTEAPLTEETPAEQQARTAVVDVKGEVMQPGVYEMEQGDRIRDIIDRADGFTENADILQVNLAQVVQDEMVVLIPAVGQEEPAVNAPAGSRQITIR